MLTTTPLLLSTMDASCHAFVRTNPCAGACGSSTLPRNQGKQIGIPPRMATPSCQRDFVLRNSTSPVLAGFQDVTCAPCRYISPSHEDDVICTRGIAPLPPQTLARFGIPNRRSSSAIVSIAFTLQILQIRDLTAWVYKCTVPIRASRWGRESTNRRVSWSGANKCAKLSSVSLRMLSLPLFALQRKKMDFGAVVFVRPIRSEGRGRSRWRNHHVFGIRGK